MFGVIEVVAIAVFYLLVNCGCLWLYDQGCFYSRDGGETCAIFLCDKRLVCDLTLYICPMKINLFLYLLVVRFDVQVDLHYSMSNVYCRMSNAEC